MPDLATLGIEIDATGAAAATAALDQFSAAAGKAETAAKGLEGAAAVSSTATASTAKALQAHTAAVNDNTRSHSLNSIQMMEAAHIVRALGEELALGVNPMRAFAMEGARISTFFSYNEGGVAGTLSAVGGIVGRLVNPLALATAGLTAFGAASIYAFASYEAGQSKLQASLNGIGQRSGSSLADLNGIAARGASAGGLSTGQGIDLAADYAGAGIAGSTNQALIGDSKAYARLTGSSVSDAGNQLAEIFKDPLKGAKTLDDQLGLLDGRLEETIRNYQAQGDLDAARAALEGRLHDSLTQATDTTWSFSKALGSAETALSNAFHAVGGAVASSLGLDSNADKLTSLQNAQANLRKVDPLGNADEITDLQKQIDPLLKAVQAEQSRAATNKVAADDRAKSLSADEIVRSVLPEITRQQTTTNNLAVLRSALADPGILDRMGSLPGQVQRAYGDLTVRGANADPTARSKQDYDLAIAAADAFSVAERGAVDARRAELAVLRETGDVSRAAAAAQMALNEVIAKANSDADDRLGMAKQDASYVGLTSYQRGRQQLIDSYSGYGGHFTEDEASKSSITESMKPVASDLKTAGDLLAQAIREAAEKAKTASEAAGPYGNLDGVHVGGSGALSRTPSNIFPMISDAADKTGISPAIIAAIGEKENGFRLTGGTSMLGSNGRPSSAYGFGQLTNAAAQDVAGVVPGFDKYNPGTAVFGSAEYLSILARRNGGNLTAALNAYGGTPGYASDIYQRAGGSPALTVHGGANDNVAPIASTALASDKEALSTQLSAYDRAAQLGPLQSAKDTILTMNNALKAQVDTLGQSKDKIAAAAFEQNVLNQYQKENITVTPEMTASIKSLGDQYAQVTKAEADFQASQQRIVGALDGVRSASNSGFGTLFSDLLNGKRAGDAFNDVLKGIEGNLLNLASKSITDSLFGQTGSANGGALGGSLSSLFGSLFGATSGSSSASLSGLFSSLFGSSSGSSGTLGIGHNAGGTDDWSGGPTWVGEKGPEIVDLPRGAQVTPNGQPAGQAAPISVQINNNVPSAQHSVTQSQGPDGRRTIQIMVEDAMAHSAQSNGKGFRAIAARSGLQRAG